MNLRIYFSPSEGPLNAFETLRIGTTEDGWQFQFQGYLEPGGPRRMRLDHFGLTVPVVVPTLHVTSVSEWLDVLRTISGRIHDNSDRTYSVPELEALIESKTPGKACPVTGRWLENPNTSAYRNRALLQHGEKLWLDREGFAFCSAESSRPLQPLGHDRPGAFS
jgi:hypothetical protein